MGFGRFTLDVLQGVLGGAGRDDKHAARLEDGGDEVAAVRERMEDDLVVAADDALGEEA
jgi:hypothetical protein